MEVYERTGTVPGSYSLNREPIVVSVQRSVNVSENGKEITARATHGIIVHEGKIKFRWLNPDEARILAEALVKAAEIIEKETDDGDRV